MSSCIRLIVQYLPHPALGRLSCIVQFTSRRCKGLPVTTLGVLFVRGAAGNKRSIWPDTRVHAGVALFCDLTNLLFEQRASCMLLKPAEVWGPQLEGVLGMCWSRSRWSSAS